MALITINGQRIERGGDLQGYLEGSVIKDKGGTKVGYTEGSRIYEAGGAQIASVEGANLVSYQNRRTYESGSARLSLEKIRKDFEDKAFDPVATGAIYELIIKPL